MDEDAWQVKSNSKIRELSESGKTKIDYQRLNRNSDKAFIRYVERGIKGEQYRNWFGGRITKRITNIFLADPYIFSAQQVNYSYYVRRISEKNINTNEIFKRTGT